MTEPADIAPNEIAEDRPCIHCGYNLRGLAPDGRCPECGEPISGSLRGNLLKHADADWLDTLRFGANLKAWNIALSILAGLAAWILVAVGFPGVFRALVELVGGAVGLWASFVITTREPSISMQEDTVTLRKVIRSCAGAGFVGTLLEQVDELSNLGTTAAIATGALSLTGLIAIFGEFVYLRRFALRIPDEKLARSTRILMWAIPVVVGCGIIAGIAVAIAAPTMPVPGIAAAPGPAPITMGTAFLTCFGLLFGAVLILWYLRLLDQYRRAFKEAAAESRALAVESREQSPDAPQAT